MRQGLCVRRCESYYESHLFANSDNSDILHFRQLSFQFSHDCYWWDWGWLWCAICLMASPTLEDARAIAEAAWTEYVAMKKDGVRVCLRCFCPQIRSILNFHGCRRGVTESADAVRLPSLLQCRSMTTRPALADMTESLQGGKSPSFLISAGGVLQGLLTRICLF